MPQVIRIASAAPDLLREAAANGTLFAVLDACDEPRVPAKVAELAEQATPLYQGEAQESLWAIAPYLVKVDTALLEWIQATLWSDPWGIFVVSQAGLEALRHHFRKFLLVTGSDGEEWYFRFYDPRVLAAFLPTCDASELANFFGPITEFGWIDSPAGEVLSASPLYFGDPEPVEPRIRIRRRG